MSDPADREPFDPDPQLAAERAATDHWRRVARQRSADYAALRHRPFVRVVLALERRLAPARRPFSSFWARLRAVRDQLVLAGASLRRRPPERSHLEARLAQLPAVADDGPLVTLVVVGPPPSAGLRIADEHRVDVVAVAPGPDAVGAVHAAFAAARGERLGLLMTQTEPLDASWLPRLGTALTGGAAAAAPVLVHPTRPRSHRTPHDGRVRSAGYTLGSDGDAPQVRAIGAGTLVDLTRPPTSVDAVSAACVLLDRAAYAAAGGLAGGDDLEVAVIECCARMLVQGGRVVVVPAVTMVDHRPVRSRLDLSQPVDPHGRAWRAAVDRSGATLLRRAQLRPDDAVRFVLTTAAPSMKVAARWGDWHLAEGLAAALRRAGHSVRVQPADAVDDLASRAADVHVVLRGLERVRATPGQRHVLWVISHPEEIEDDELDAADLVLVASRQFADHLRTRTATPVDVLLQATDPDRFHPVPAAVAHRHPITVVAKTRDVMRPVVADALAVGLRPSIYGGGWERLVDPRLVVADHVDNRELPVVYASAGVVLNDHWRTMRAWGFVSNRLFDVMACATPVVSDAVPGIAELFHGAVLEYHDPPELRALVEEVLGNPSEARARAERGRVAVLGAHTFDHRAAGLLAALDGYGILR